MSETEEFWRGEFGNQYHERCRVDWRQRIKFWSQILDLTGARSVYEWGCGPGWNLSAIKAASQSDYLAQCWEVECCGTEINEQAVSQAQNAGLEVYTGEASEGETAELVCTVGALIHVDPDYVKDIMQNLIKASSDYVLCVEYESPEKRGIEYRGHKDKLWAMPYGELYRGLGLDIVMQADAGPGFDDCTATLLRKAV
jgi:hypothetical protein